MSILILEEGPLTLHTNADKVGFRKKTFREEKLRNRNDTALTDEWSMRWQLKLKIWLNDG